MWRERLPPAVADLCRTAWIIIMACAVLLISCTSSTSPETRVEPSSAVTSEPSAPSKQPTPSKTQLVRGQIAPGEEFKVGTVSLWYSDSQEWHGSPLFIAVVRPSEDDFYALDLMRVLLGEVSCKDVEGSGQRVDKGTNDILFDCPDRSVYARFNKYGAPGADNDPKANFSLPAYRLVVDSADMLNLTETRIRPGRVMALWH